MVDSPLNFGGLEETFSDYSRARFVILPVPYERTTCYGKGTASGPEAIIDASRNMELYDEELSINTAESGIATLDPVVVDDEPEVLIGVVKAQVTKILSDGKFPVVLGGEHSISLGVYLALKEFYGDVSVLQLDAHTDLRDSYQGSPYSHACVMRRIRDHTRDIVQVGIRSMCEEEAEIVERDRERVFFAQDLAERDPVEDIVAQLGDTVFVTIDVDALDPSIMPATGTPEPGGLGWYTALKILSAVAAEKRIVGFDVVELAPIKGMSAPDYTAAKLVYRMMGYVNAFSFNDDL